MNEKFRTNLSKTAENLISPFDVGDLSPAAVEIQGRKLPPIMIHSTTREGFLKMVGHGGDLISSNMDAQYGSDPRSWPKHGCDPKMRVMIVFSTALAFDPKLGGNDSDSNLTILRTDVEGYSAHIRFMRLPKDSYELIDGQQVDIGNPGEQKIELDAALNAARQKLLSVAHKASL